MEDPDQAARRDPGAGDAPESWPVVARRDLHRDSWVVALRSDTIHAPNKPEPEFPRLVLEHPGSVHVLAVDDGQVLVLEQYRHPVQLRVIELPAGLRDVGGEEPEITARRELAEEAEVEADHWEHLISSTLSPGISTERAEVFLATGIRAAGRGDFTPAHEEADMTRRWVPLGELVGAVTSSQVTDAVTQLAVLAYAARPGSSG